MTSTDSRNTQRSRILALLLRARGEWVPLPEILALGIAQYGARLYELRRLGFRIENRRDGEHSAFRLVAGPSSRMPATSAPALEAGSLFGDLAPESRFPD